MLLIKLYCSFLKGIKNIIIPLLIALASALDAINGKLDIEEQHLREKVWGTID